MINIIGKIILILIGFCIGYILKEKKNKKNTKEDVFVETVKNEVNNDFKEITNEKYVKKQENFEEKQERFKSYSERYKKKWNFWDSNSERIAYINIKKYIEKYENELNLKNYKVELIPHISLREIFKSANKKYEKENLEKLSMYHVDMLLVDSIWGDPLIGIEVDGINHDSEDQILRDTFKNEIFTKNDIPLIRIPSNEIDNKNYIISNINKKMRYINRACPNCGRKMMMKKNSGTGEDFLGCTNFSGSYGEKCNCSINIK
ncbi:DUF2726 domain-containing protein [Clostridium perfringens]|nr:DUF2726 domain-containing protein [Clostridium perfringens]